MTAAPPFYITTPIYYVNDKPHIGHGYTTTLCDVAARFMRFAGRDVFFLTGTDEHAAKVVDSAKERGLTPQQWADQNAQAFREAFALLGISNDDFVRTTEDRHKSRVQRYVAELMKSGDVYLGDFEGWYDAGQEEYVTDGKAKDCDYKSPINGKPLVRRKEHNYFFRLSAYREPLLKMLEKGERVDGAAFDVLPAARKNEIISRIREMEDVPISRTGTLDWGIRIPGDEQHTIYVWIDALFNYLSTVDTPERKKYWPGAIHVIAKDILWFHAAIWPAMLLALRRRAGYEWVALPRFVYSHSFWISEGQKMSKSLGNFIDLPTIRSYLDRYSLDAWRYYMTTQGPLGATDADFAAAHFRGVYDTDLKNTVGNCASRVTAMIGKYFAGAAPTETGASGSRMDVLDWNWPSRAAAAVERAFAAIEAFDLAAATGEAVKLVRDVDAFINAAEPFRRAKDPAKMPEVGAILYQCAEAVRIASCLLWPVMPGKMESLWRALGQAIDPNQGRLRELAAWGGLKPGTTIEKVALFPPVEEALAGTSA
jgi:methionyl-tRNA synthetase